MGLRCIKVAIMAILLFNCVASAGDQNFNSQEGSDVEVDRVEDQIEANHPPAVMGSLAIHVDYGEGEDVGMWPWDNKNKTPEDNSCKIHKNCEECSTSSYFCHWCSHDNACHSKGSIHGCFEGVTCEPPKPKENSTCASHATCSDCALSSSVCHWCAHDNACHLVGSVYGCVSGVDCYSNDRCQRYQAEPISGVFMEEIGVWPFLIIFGIGMCCCCCATLAFCAAVGVKGAYDDIVVVAAGNPEGSLYGGEPRTVTFSNHPSVVNYPAPINEHDNEDDTEGDSVQENDDEESPSRDGETSQTLEVPPVETQSDANNLNEDASLLDNNFDQYQDAHDGYTLMTGMVSAAPSAYATVQARGGSNSMQTIFNLCRICYVVTLIAVVAFVGGSIRSFPRAPTYNVCNDNIAWKSLVESMASLKAEATFEILVSVLNPNHFGVAVDMGRGNFKHQGVFVGTFDIPPTTLPSMSVMDIRVLAHFTPSSWEALSLTSEYRKGTLAFDIDAKATFRFPGLFDYSFSGSFNDIHVRVNDPALDDRHLCACPTWKDGKNHTQTIS